MDAVVTAIVILLLGLVATAPFGAERGNEAASEFWLAIGLNVVFVVVTFLKGKLKLALVGVVFPPLAWVGAFRLAKPSSWWARRFYDPSGRRYRRAVAREAKRHDRWQARQTRFYDLLGGTPSRPSSSEASDGRELDGR